MHTNRRTFLFVAGAAVTISVLPLSLRAADKQKIGIIGSGNVGGALGSVWVKAGYEVRFASRHLAQAIEAASDLIRKSGNEPAPIDGLKKQNTWCCLRCLRENTARRRFGVLQPSSCNRAVLAPAGADRFARYLLAEELDTVTDRNLGTARCDVDVVNNEQRATGTDFRNKTLMPAAVIAVRQYLHDAAAVLVLPAATRL